MSTQESDSRRYFLESFLPKFKSKLSKIVNSPFSIDVVGSVAKGTAMNESDIDLLLKTDKNSKYESNKTKIASVKLLDQTIKENNLPYKIDLWFEGEYQNIDKPINSKLDKL